MDFILSYNNNEQVLVFPVVPNDLEHLEAPQDNGTFESLNGAMNVIGPMGLRSFPMESIFPVHDYSWLRPGSSADGWSYVDAINEGRSRYIPFRAVLLRSDGGEVFNMACTVDSFTYVPDAVGDIHYKLTLREYRFSDYTR